MQDVKYKPVQIVNDKGVLSAFILENRAVQTGMLQRERLIAEAQETASRWNANWPEVNARVSS